MRLDLGFRAESAEEAEAAALEWSRAEPNVESMTVVSVEAQSGFLWTVTVQLVFHSDNVQEQLGLVA